MVCTTFSVIAYFKVYPNNSTNNVIRYMCRLTQSQSWCKSSSLSLSSKLSIFAAVHISRLRQIRTQFRLAFLQPQFPCQLPLHLHDMLLKIDSGAGGSEVWWFKATVCPFPALFVRFFWYQTS